MSSPSFVSSVSFFCLLVLLLPAQHDGASSYSSYKLGSTQVFFKTPGKSSGNSQQASKVTPASTCSSIATTGLAGNNKLPVVHRQSPCSPLHGQPSLTTADVLRRDRSLVRRRFSSLSSSVIDAQAPSPAAVIIPTNSSSEEDTPSALDYSVVVSFGTPEQKLPLFLDNSGNTMLGCKSSCPSGSDDCDLEFDTSRSSTFAHVLCGSPDCPTDCPNGSVCTYEDALEMNNDTFAKDVLTLAPSMAVRDFRFVCVDEDQPSQGTLDLSRNPNSLPSRLSPSSQFSYCLPHYLSSQGFLAVGGNATVGNDDYNLTSHAPLVNSSYPELSDMYFIDVVGMILGGEDLAVPAGTFGGGNARTAVDLGTTFAWLVPDAYDALTDAFLKQMSQLNNLSVTDLLVPGGFAGFDTCFNFTALDQLTVPGASFKFSNGERMLVFGDQMLYFEDPVDGPFVGLSCLAYSSLDAGVDVFSAIIGTYTLTSTEVIYDVAGGKVGFVPFSC